MKQKDLPIGYWIKQADQLLTNGINAVHNTQGIDRTGWQILHTIQQEPNIELEKMAGLLEPFADSSKLADTLHQLSNNGWISTNNAQLFLTVSGEAFHASCLQLQKAFREKSMQHISPGDYQITLNTLRQLVQNLS